MFLSIVFQQGVSSGVADRAESVKYILTTNKAESFMNIRMHFEGEKIVDRSQGGSNKRCEPLGIMLPFFD